jgi:hypothetical protein
MATFAVNAIVLGITLVLSIQPVGQLLFPPAPPNLITTVRVAAGSHETNDGNVPGIHLFDLDGVTIGLQRGSNKLIDKGQPKDIKIAHIDQLRAAAQTEYMSVVTGGNNALCISYITVTLPNNLQYSWNGDIGFQCGGLWMFGNTTFSADIAGGIYQPRCLWIDGDDSNGIHTKAFGVHLPSFLANTARVDQYNLNNDVMCKADPRFKLYDQLDVVNDAIPHFVDLPFDQGTLLDFDPAHTLDPNNWATTPVDIKEIIARNPDYLEDSGNARNDTSAGTNSSSLASTSSQDGNNPSPTNTAANASGDKGSTVKSWNGVRIAPKQHRKHVGKLIKSQHKHHSAKQLCESNTSWGPDFISLAEGLYCDMDQKKTWPTCNDMKQRACFDVTVDRMRLGTANNRRDLTTGRIIPRKVYSNVENW